MYIPAITGLVQRLSSEFDITVYTVVKPDDRSTPFLCGNAAVKYIRSRSGNHALSIALRAVQEFRRDHRVHNYSLVHGFWALPGGLAAVLAGRLCRLPSVVSLLGGEAAFLPAINYGNMNTGARRSTTLWICRNAETLTALTNFQLQGLRRFKFDRTGETYVIPFGADAKLFRAIARKPLAPPFNIVHIGSLNRVKDQTTLLRAFQKISRQIDARLRIIGEDTLGGFLEGYARDLGISDRVAFLGLVPYEKLRDQFDWAHALLHSSLYEGQGVVFSEAAASEVLICGTRVGLLSDLGDTIGVAVEPGDYEALAENLLRVVEDPAVFTGHLMRARSWAAEHTADWTASQFAELYRRRLRAPQDVDASPRESSRLSLHIEA